jgi:hypothetical protein
MQKLGIKDSLPGLLAMPFFSSVLYCLHSPVLLASFSFFSPCFLLFSFPSSLLCFPFIESWR